MVGRGVKTVSVPSRNKKWFFLQRDLVVRVKKYLSGLLVLAFALPRQENHSSSLRRYCPFNDKSKNYLKGLKFIHYRGIVYVKSIGNPI